MPEMAVISHMPFFPIRVGLAEKFKTAPGEVIEAIGETDLSMSRRRGYALRLETDKRSSSYLAQMARRSK